MINAERVTIFGDLRDINIRSVTVFIEATNHLIGGGYPTREDDIPDGEVIGKTRKLLTEAGVPDSYPITLCSTSLERAEQILQACLLRREQNGLGLYWIIDRDPHSFVEAVKSFRDQSSLPTDILNSTTIVDLISTSVDYSDPTTGIRVVKFPQTPYRFPAHPTPAS